MGNGCIQGCCIVSGQWGGKLCVYIVNHYEACSRVSSGVSSREGDRVSSGVSSGLRSGVSSRELELVCIQYVRSLLHGECYS